MTTKYLQAPAASNQYQGTVTYGSSDASGSNGNPYPAVCYLKLTPLGTSPQTWSVIERIDGTTLVASSSYPKQAACYALRARGESKSLTVTFQTLLNNGGWADGESVLLGGFAMQMVANSSNGVDAGA